MGDSMMEVKDESLGRRHPAKMFRSILGKRDIAVILITIILLSSALGYIYFFGEVRVKHGLVGIVRIEGPILTSSTAEEYVNLINEAIENDSIKAVVLLIDSPGGYADLIEEIYLDLLVLSKKKPLVAMATMALSGGYYIAVAAKYIIVHPTSYIGNIGVIGIEPPILIPSEMILETGAYKVTGFSRLLFPFNLSRALDNFVSAVMKGREGRLKLSQTELRRGKIYLGVEAVKNGLADGIGSLQNATSIAAEMAGLTSYRVVDVTLQRGQRSTSNTTSSLFRSEWSWKDLTIEKIRSLHPVPSIYYLYLPPTAFTGNFSGVKEGKPIMPPSNGTVIVDMSHGNKISWLNLNVLASELVKKGVNLRFITEWADLKEALPNATCLIIASPTSFYSSEEVDQIGRFVEAGGLLLLFYDPAYEYIDISRLFAPINSLASRFGLLYASGYLYDEKRNFGMYRNIYITDFKNDSLTWNLKSIVMFTATHIYSKNNGLAWTSPDTFSSTAEKTGRYAVIASTKIGSGRVIAFGDLTFLSEPYCYVEDNYKLIVNLANLILSVKAANLTLEGKEKPAIGKPNLPVGTEKNYSEWVDGQKHLVRWSKISKYKVKVERLNQTSIYLFDNKGGLYGLETSRGSIIYKPPIPAPPFPLTVGKSWNYRSIYIVMINVTNEEYNGSIRGSRIVEDLVYVLAGNNKSYFSAKIRAEDVESLIMDGKNITVVSSGFIWISSEVGVVKQEVNMKYYVDGRFIREVSKRLLLLSISKGKS